MHRMLFDAVYSLIDGIKTNDFGSMAIGAAALFMVGFGWYLLHGL